MSESRRAFHLQPEDQLFLDDTLGLPWETIREGSLLWLFIHNFDIPPGYTTRSVSLALQIPNSYPTAQIDMAYFSPALARSDGKTIRALSSQAIGGKPWQRWSRHRTSANPWRSGVDCVETHLLLVREWLRR